MTTDNTTTEALGLGEQAYQRLKQDIVWCVLRPGEDVSEARLAQAYGLGKAPVRQALLRLSQEGYVLSIPRRGHVISPVTLQTVKDIFELRLLIEPAAVDKACGRVDRQQLVALDAKCGLGYKPGCPVSEAAFMNANRAFHLAIAVASGNVRLARALAQILDEMTRLLHLGFVLRERPNEMHLQHAELIEALVSGDRIKARNMTTEHINSVRALVIDGIITHSSLNSTNIVPA